MCGIAGIANKNKIAVTQSDLESAIKTIAHRGPDGQGFFIFQDWGIGNCRLSIIDLKERSNQPLQYKNHYISFNGAIYNYLELRKELKSLGHCFKTTSDTEVILAAYIEWGEACVQKFNGMWAFAIYDPINQLIFCSRDRFGIKPFYYFENSSIFCFASEIKAVLNLSRQKATLDAQAVYRFLAFGEQDYSSNSFFKRIKKLTPGHSLFYNLKNHQLKLKRYYSLPENLNLELSVLQAANQFKSLLYDSVALRFRGDVPIGACLSGGLDSSSLLASIHDQRLADDVFCSITAYYPGKFYDERKYATAISHQTGYRNVQISPSQENMLSDLSSLIYMQDEPIPSAGVWLQNHVFSRAKQEGLKVMIDGQGGDEILAGYDIFHYNYITRNLRNNPWVGLSEAIYFLLNFKGPLNKKYRSFFRHKSKQKQQSAHWFELNFQNFDTDNTTDKSLSDISRRLLSGMGIQALLHYEDRNSMAHSIESRLPFLDYRLVEFCLSLEDHHKINNGRRKTILRKAFQDILPKKINARKDKLGFEIPYVEWMKKNNSMLEQLYQSSLKSLSFIDDKKLSLNQDWEFKWRVITLRKWMEVFNVFVS